MHNHDNAISGRLFLVKRWEDAYLVVGIGWLTFLNTIAFSIYNEIPDYFNEYGLSLASLSTICFLY